MHALLAEVEKQARALPPEERARLAELLLESLPGGSLSVLEAEWQSEIEIRVAAYEAGQSMTVTGDEVFAEAQRIAR